MPKKRGPYLKDIRRSSGSAGAHFIKKYRLKQKMTLEDVAGATGLSVGSISAIERGEQDPRLATLQLLSDVLKAPRGHLLDIDPTKGAKR